MTEPKVSLQFAAPTKTFTMTAESVRDVSYSLRYTIKQQKLEQALTGKGKADSKNRFTVTHIAGTESSGAKVLHDVTEGVLEVTAKTPDDHDYVVKQNFLITDQGKIQVVSSSVETSVIQGSVQGAMSENAELSADPQATSYELQTSPIPQIQPQTFQVFEENTLAESESNQSSSAQQDFFSGSTPYIYGAGVITLLLVISTLVFFVYRRDKQQPQEPL